MTACNLGGTVASLNTKAGSTVCASIDLYALRNAVVALGGTDSYDLATLYNWVLAWSGPGGGSGSDPGGGGGAG